ncbi:ribose-phosphate diphosphokinase [Sandaracinus amylolyticus]|uniref:ribose-phosphate diphosphokinase n=1 Tax=Sandaracinus amylolyticus TaxID=927083 RepID=UPI0009466E89|nr:ribose-phosphate pyrophosphokinase [Sandaracinus amylolyticus]
MEPCVVIGSAHRALGEQVAREVGVAPARCTIARFPDGEIHVELGEHVAGRDVFVVQPTIAPVGETLLELLLVADAARRAGAARVIALVSYFGYARADRRTRAGQPLAARVAAALFERTLFDRVVAIDLHSAPIEGFFSIPLEHLDAVPRLASVLEEVLPERAVIVSPDLGASKRADALAARWRLPVAIVHKTRVSGSDVIAREVTGDVSGRRPVIVDDMISTGGTLVTATEALLAHGALDRPVIAATHALCVGDSIAKLAAIGVERLVATDSVPPPSAPFDVRVVSVAPLLADAVRHIASSRDAALPRS